MSLAKHVEPKVTEARLARQWDAVAERLDARPRRSRVWIVVFGLAAAAAVAAAVVVFRAPPPTSPFEGAVVESGAGSMDLRFRDGRITLEPRSTLAFVETWPDRVRLDLREGTARFDVAHRRGRTFVVTAGRAEVDVVGTLFRVTHEAERVVVSVARGLVDVRRGGSTTRLHAGETWSIGPPPPRAAPEPRTDALRRPAAPSSPALAPASSAPVAIPQPRTSEPPTATGAPETAAPTIATASARELFDLANVARRDRRLPDAAAAYDEVLHRFPGDPRAGLAAYELGRLRLDSLGDLAGAITALERAQSFGAVREGAMSRLAEAYERAGRTADCARVRDDYLARYPEGVHAAGVRGRCGGR